MPNDRLAEELAEKYGLTWVGEGSGVDILPAAVAAINEAIDRTLERAKTDMLAMIDSDELYDILPGNGQDDFICGVITQEIEKRFRALKGTL